MSLDQLAIKHVTLDAFGQTRGLVIENDEKWQTIRSKTQQDMMRPKSALFYTSGIQETAHELTNYIRTKVDAEGKYPVDFLPDLYTWAFESIALVALDYKLNAFNSNATDEVKHIIEINNKLTEQFAQLLFGIPWHKFVPNPR